MRTRRKHAGLSVNAIAGSHVVLLGIDIVESLRAGLRGFAVRRNDPTEGETYWMKGTKTFEAIEPHPAPGEQFSSLSHPFQTFQWADYSAKPGRPYNYEVVALYGELDAMEARATVKVDVRTEPESGVDHSVFFNRGAPATQEYARRFRNERPSKAGPGAYEWLSRGLLEGIVGFVQRAEGPGWSLRGAFYEFQWPAALEAFVAARDRGVEVSIVFDAVDGASGPRPRNIKAIEDAGLDDVTVARTNGKLMHNKFIVLMKDGEPVAVLLGSTNLTENGLFGHANCAHVIEDTELARTYLKYLTRLDDDPETALSSGYKVANMDLSPAPTDSLAALVPVFSPRSNVNALRWYAELAGSAQSGLFMTFAFGMNELFRNVYGRKDGLLRMALMEKEYNGRGKEEQIAAIRDIQRLPNVVVAVGNHIPLTGFDQWLGEMDRVSSRTHVQWVHTKFMLVDPLSDDPTVITGSANFSKASTDTNDKNMTVIRGSTRVADMYLGEFFRLHSHYAFRQAVAIHMQREPGSGPDGFQVRFLEAEKDWTADYFEEGDRNARYLRRRYFSGT